MTDITRVLIVAGHTAVRAEMHTIFQLADGIEVVGEAACLSEAVCQAQALRPDVALVDLETAAGEENGLSIVARLKTQHLVKAIVVLTAYDDPAAQKNALRCGATAVIIKGADFNSMLDMIQKSVEVKR